MNDLTLEAVTQTLSDKEVAKIWLRSLLASTNSQNIEANTNFLYELITGEQV